MLNLKKFLVNSESEVLMKFFRKLKNKYYLFSLKRNNINSGFGKINQKIKVWNSGQIQIGNNFSIGYYRGGGFDGRSTELQTRDREAILRIGDNFQSNNGLFICCLKKIIIGDDCLIGSNVTIMNHNAHGVNPLKRKTSQGTPHDIVIENNVWIGNGVTILGGTFIGENSIVSVGSVVKGSFPSNVIIQGNPAVIVKSIEKN